MHKKHLLLTIFIYTLFILFSETVSASKVEDMFLKAVDTLDFREADAYVKENSDKIPFEIDRALAQSRDENIKKKERLNFIKIADAMATSYGKVTGDSSYISTVKARYFDEKLSEKVVADTSIGLHRVEIRNKKFTVNNLVIKAGDTVQWVNRDERPHVFRSSLEVGKRGLYSDSIGFNKVYNFKFTEVGEYFYHSTIYKKKMIGKITVVKAPVVEAPAIVEEEPVEEAEKAVKEEPEVNATDRKKRIKELLEKFDYEPDD